MAKVVRQFASVFLFLILLGCLEEKNIVQTPVDDGKIVNLEADLVHAIMDVTSQDGSLDNILDNSSCLTAMYPYSVRVRGVRVDLNSPDDIPALESLYEQEITNPNQFQIIYPVRVSKADYSIVEVSNSGEMKQLQAECVEGGEDPDIECVDFVYPVNISSLDTLNQVANVIEVYLDESFYHLMEKANDPDNSQILEITYPVTLLDFNGNTLTAESNDALTDAIESYRNSCVEGDSTYVK
ncbi:hypothetical protein [Ekhidna sp.]|uniref:hypothetical protein n=1 Tax=Ekhidna sp. TaxID=2608089 RepID=UPI003B59D59D